MEVGYVIALQLIRNFAIFVSVLHLQAGEQVSNLALQA
jgi:hypothetical protein